MNIGKRALVLMLSVLMTFSTLPVSVFAGDEAAPAEAPKQVEAQEPVKEKKPEPTPEAPAEPKEEAAPETPAAEPAAEPVAETPATETADPVAEKQTGEEAPKAEEAAPTETEETPEKEEVEYPAQTLKVTASDGAVITVKAPEGAFPEGSYVKATPVSEEAVLALIDGAAEAAAYDITIYDKDGNEIQPEKPVKVSMANTGLEEADAVYYVNDAMTKATLVTDNIDDPSDTFTVDHFSIYVIEYIGDSETTLNGVPIRASGGMSTNNVNGQTVTLHVGDSYMVTNDASGTSANEYNQSKLNEWNNAWHIWDNGRNIRDGSGGLGVQMGGYRDSTIYGSDVMPYLIITVNEPPQGSEYRIQYYSTQYADNPPNVHIKVVYQYDVTFNMNGHGEAIDKQTVDEGTKATKPEDPTADGYIFKGWYKNEACTGDAFDFSTAITANTPLYAKWVESKTVTFKNYDGTELSSKEYAINTPASDIEIPDDPTKEADDNYVYTFDGWDKEIAAVTEDVVYTATYTAKSKYTVTFCNYDGTEISTGRYVDGTAIADIAPTTTPERASTQEYNYTFAGWATQQDQSTGQQASELPDVSVNVTYYAAFTQSDRTYYVRFWDDVYPNNQRTLVDDVWVKYGDSPVYPGETPTKAGTAQYTYTFKGWSDSRGTLYEGDLPAITKNTDLYATFERTVNQYKVKFVDEDGETVLLAEKEYDYGTTVAKIQKPDDPTKEDDEGHRYTFTGWSPAITNVTKDQTYTATYSSTNLYKITFVDEDGTTVLKEETKYPEGTAAADIEKPDDPTKEATDDYTYEFDGWDPEPAEVTKDQVYTAKYKQLDNYYLNVEQIHAFVKANYADVEEASSKTSVGATSWVDTQDKVNALAASVAGQTSGYPPSFRDYFQPGETYYSVAVVEFPEGETPDAKRVKINETEFVKAAGTPMVNESENELVVPFSVTIPGITVTVEFGSKHAALASQAAENAPAGVVMSASGGTLTYKAEKGSDRWYDVTGPLRDVLSDISNKDNGEQMFRGFVSYNLHPIDYYADAEACYAEMETAMDSVPQNENMKLYILWTKPTGAEVTIAKPVCGTEVAIDQENSKQTGAPEVSVTGGNVSVYDVISPMWIDTETDRPQPYEGTIKGGETYKAMAVLLPDFGYYLDPDKVTVKGGTLEEGMGMGGEMITIAVEADHDWGEWQMTKKPTATEFGVETRVCKHCDKEQTRQIAKIPEYTITYDLNGGTLDGEKGKVTFKVEAGTEITLPEPTRKGYEFDYWKGSKYEAGDTYTVNGNHTFTAQWIAETTDSKKSKGVDTGDAAGLVVWLLLGIAAEAGAVYMYRRRREY